jgi:hypothetical protein
VQGGCEQHFFDGATQNLVEVVSKMMFTPYNLPVERWFFERDGKDPDEDPHPALASFWTHPVRVCAKFRARGTVKNVQVMMRAAVAGLKTGQELTTSVTPYNWLADVHPEHIAFFFLCVEKFLLDKFSAVEDGRSHARRAMHLGGQEYAAPAPCVAPNAGLPSKMVFLFCNSFEPFKHAVFCYVTVLLFLSVACVADSNWGPPKPTEGGSRTWWPTRTS